LASSDQDRVEREAEALKQRFLLLPAYQRAAVARFVRMMAEGNATPRGKESSHAPD
jgi:hypothetical protein